MNLFALMIRELWHDRPGLILSTASLGLVAAIFTGLSVALAGFDQQARAALAARQALVEARVAELEDAMRRITKGLGFNVLILPGRQELGELYAEDFASRTMPEAYADRLAASRVVTVNHLLPTLERRIAWPERRQREVLLVGVRGEVPLLHRDPMRPLVEPVPAGMVAVGHEVARGERITKGDTIEVMGRSFQVAGVNPARGDRRDISLWLDLGTVQEMLGMQGRINGIWALQCRCALADVAKVRAEIESILPDTQVVEKGTIALARAEARSVAAREARAALELERQTQSDQQRQRRRFSLLTIVSTALAASLVVGVSAWRNVRERRREIGVFCALGMRRRQIGMLILSKAGFLGLCGGLAGLLLGVPAVLLAGRFAGAGPGAVETVPWYAALAVLVPPVIACLAALAPALAAARQDPADTLRDEGLFRGT